jgi:hypothetical protein
MKSEKVDGTQVNMMGGMEYEKVHGAQVNMME